MQDMLWDKSDMNMMTAVTSTGSGSNSTSQRPLLYLLAQKCLPTLHNLLRPISRYNTQAAGLPVPAYVAC